MIKLNLACGDDYLDGYTNVDLYHDGKVDARFDVSTIPYEDNSVDEIKAFHIIEHFDWHKGKDVLKEWHRVLKPNGRLYLETPDFLASCRDFVNGSPDYRIHLYGHFFSMPWIKGQEHLFLFTEDQLRTHLMWTGFNRVNRLPPASKYLEHYPAHLFLTVEAFK
jgi:predicted SAM-dependent methyltransferase